MPKLFKNSIILIALLLAGSNALARQPLALDQVYIPDFSYAGYRYGESQPDTRDWTIIDVTKHGLMADDGIDDTKALNALLHSLVKSDDPVVLQFGNGRYELSDIIHINRSHIVLRGTGTAPGSTEFFFPRPLLYVDPPAELNELNEYLVSLNKVQKEKDKNIKLPFTAWSWTGGFFWTGIRGERVKAYMSQYDKETPHLASVEQGGKDDFTFEVDDAEKLHVGQVVQINWYNPDGENGSFLQQLYGESDVKVGSHHWNSPKMPLSRQQTEITGISGNSVTIRTPLLHDARSDWNVDLTSWKHLTEVGMEQFRISFPQHPQVAHHVEPGFNGIYLTRVLHSWVRDVVIANADSAILTEGIANVTIERVATTGNSLAHYSVQLGGVHNVLVKDLRVENHVIHPLSFNTFANKSVYLDAFVKLDPVLDQHSGANHQNLFDHTRVEIDLGKSPDSTSYPLFEGGGAGYWKPSHGIFSTFWNTEVVFTNGAANSAPILLHGMKDGPNARVVGVHANLPIRVEYGPDAYIEGVGQYFHEVPSLYYHQLTQRLSGKSPD